MEGELDLRRLGELEQLLGRRVPEIVATLVEQLAAAMAAIAAAVAAGDLDAAALAAHSARNSALMIDAEPLLGRLAALEAAARRRDAPAALAAAAELREAWPRLRRGLEHAAARC